MLLNKTNKVFCNQITPPEFTAEQIAKCRKCGFASGKKLWCGHFGAWIREAGKIITSKLVRPSDKIRLPKQPCNEKDFETDYEKDKDMYAGMSPFGNQNYEVVGKEEYVDRKKKCRDCPDKYSCPKRGCMSHEIVRKVWQCPKGKW